MKTILTIIALIILCPVSLWLNQKAYTTKYNLFNNTKPKRTFPRHTKPTH